MLVHIKLNCYCVKTQLPDRAERRWNSRGRSWPMVVIYSIILDFVARNMTVDKPWRHVLYKEQFVFFSLWFREAVTWSEWCWKYFYIVVCFPGNKAWSHIVCIITINELGALGSVCHTMNSDSKFTSLHVSFNPSFWSWRRKSVDIRLNIRTTVQKFLQGINSASRINSPCVTHDYISLVQRVRFSSTVMDNTRRHGHYS